MSRLFEQRRLLFTLLFVSFAVSVAMLSDSKFGFYIPFVVLVALFEPLNENKFVRLAFESLPLFFFVVAAILSLDLFYILVNLLIIILISKIALPKKKLDYYEIFVVGFMLLILSSVSTISIAFSLLLFLVFLSGALMLIYANLEPLQPALTNVLPQTLFFSLISYLMSFLIFFSVPRLSLGFVHGNSLLFQSKSGFSETVQIDNSRIQLDNTVIMRIETKINTVPLYVSGLRYAIFSGKEWVRDSGTEKLYPLVDEVFGSNSGIESTVYLEPTGTNVLFGVDVVNGIRGSFVNLFRDSFGDYLTDAIFYRTIKYDVYSDTSTLNKVKLSKVQKTQYTQLPQLSDNFIDLVMKVVSGKSTDFEKMQALVNYLDSNCKYSLTPTYTTIEDFVLKGGEGYCEHFATALAIMSRVAGIPSRLVSGYKATEYNATYGYYIIRNSDAHTWVEAYVDNSWVRFDPTPPTRPRELSFLSTFIDSLRMSWYRNIISYDLTKQFEFASRLGKGISSISKVILNSYEFLRLYLKYVVAIILIIPLFVFFVKKSKRKDHILAAVLSLLGNDKLDSETIKEYAERKRSNKETLYVIDLYYLYRFGNDTRVVKKIFELIDEIKSKKHYLTN